MAEFRNVADRLAQEPRSLVGAVAIAGLWAVLAFWVGRILLS